MHHHTQFYLFDIYDWLFFTTLRISMNDLFFHHLFCNLALQNFWKRNSGLTVFENAREPFCLLTFLVKVKPTFARFTIAPPTFVHPDFTLKSKAKKEKSSLRSCIIGRAFTLGSWCIFSTHQWQESFCNSIFWERFWLVNLPRFPYSDRPKKHFKNEKSCPKWWISMNFHKLGIISHRETGVLKSLFKSCQIKS